MIWLMVLANYLHAVLDDGDTHNDWLSWLPFMRTTLLHLGHWLIGG